MLWHLDTLKSPLLLSRSLFLCEQEPPERFSSLVRLKLNGAISRFCMLAFLPFLLKANSSQELVVPTVLMSGCICAQWELSKHLLSEGRDASSLKTVQLFLLFSLSLGDIFLYSES